MGWAVATVDGQEVGCAVEGVCGHPGCGKRVMLGLDAACGGMHGQGQTYHADGDGTSCAGYFCDAHLRTAWMDEETDLPDRLCFACAETVEVNQGTLPLR